VSQFAPEDSQGTIDLVSNGDITFEADRDQDGAGDLVFRTGGVERARIKHDGSGTGWPNVLGGSISAIGAAIKAAVVSDSDFAAPIDGDVGINTTTNLFAYRSGGAWYSALAFTSEPSASSPIQSFADPGGNYTTNGIIAGNASGYGYSGSGHGVFAPGFSSHHQFGIGTPGANVLGSTQGRFNNIEYWGPTIHDSAQAANDGVYMKDPGASHAYTQTFQITANETDCQVEGNVTLSNTYMAGTGARLTVLKGATLTNSPGYGFKASYWTQNNKDQSIYGSAYQWRAFYDDLYNPAGSTFDSNASHYGLNQIVTEQGFQATRTGYGGSMKLVLHGSGGSPNTMMTLQVPDPNTTTSVADGAFTSGSNMMTTATAPSAGWIGRVVANANVPAGTRVLNFVGTGPYTIVLDQSATGTASSQTVTFTEPDLTALLIKMASGNSTGNALDIRDTSGTQRLVVSRIGALRTIGQGILTQNGSGQTVNALNPNGDSSVQIGNNISGTGALGARLWSGSGAPSKPGNTNPTAGDWFLRTDTPSTANQRLYVCTTGGASPVWAGVV
jgi:hypothetical protein